MPEGKLSVLIVDDEETICDLLSDELVEHGCECTKAINGMSALNDIACKEYNIALLDIKLPDLSGIDLLKAIRDRYSDTGVIMITAVNDIDTAVTTMKLGASDYIVKPFDLERILFSIASVLQGKSCQRQMTELDSIAQGVEEKQELIDCHSEKVTEATVKIARQLSIPDDEIDAWAVTREKAKHARKGKVDRVVRKFLKGLLTQGMSSLEEVQRLRIMFDDSRN